MHFRETPVSGAFILEPERFEDDRGFFARVWCQKEFEDRGLDSAFVQSSISFNRRRGTLRGMHYQTFPHGETKLVRCTAGAIFDVLVDLRLDSPTYLQSFSVSLSAENHQMIYIPKYVAHGFQALTDAAEVTYQMSVFHSPAFAAGVRWDDAAFGINWPIDDPILSDRDRTYPDYEAAAQKRAA